jgi:hypothetical protein
MIYVLREARLGSGQLAAAPLTELDERLDSNQASLVVLESHRKLLVLGNECIDTLAEKYDVLAVLDDFGQ